MEYPNELITDGYLDVGFKRHSSRRWPDEVKAKIVSETLEPGTRVRSVAERYGIKPNHLSTWRRLAKEGKLILPAEAIETVKNEPIAFAPLIPKGDTVSACDIKNIELRVGKVNICLGSETNIDQIAALVHSLNEAS